MKVEVTPSSAAVHREAAILIANRKIRSRRNGASTSRVMAAQSLAVKIEALKRAVAGGFLSQPIVIGYCMFAVGTGFQPDLHHTA
jgi:hypothetical protein